MKLGYQRLSKLLFSIDHLEIDEYYNTSNRRIITEYYIQWKLILLWYNKLDKEVQVKQGEVEFRNLLKMQLLFQLQFQM